MAEAEKFRDLKPAEQQAEQEKRFLAFVAEIEKDKLLHFVLAHEQSGEVLIMRSPGESKEIKKFLGYEWSSTKGDEGIKLIKDAHGHHLTPLYDQTNRDNPAKLNHAVSQNFTGKLNAIAPTLEPYLSLVPLVDLLDFSRTAFEKQIALGIKKRPAVTSKWPIAKLGDICSLEYGESLPEAKRIPGPYPVLGSNGRVGFHNQFLIEGPAIIVGRKGSAGELFWEDLNCYPIDTTFYVKLHRKDISLRFLYEQLKLLKLTESRVGIGVPGLNRNDAHESLLALPPLEIQEQVLVECAGVDKDVNDAAKQANKARQKVDSIVASIYSSSFPRLTIDDVSSAVQYGLSEAMNEGGVGYKIFRMNEIKDGRTVDNGEMKYADVSAQEFAKVKLNVGDVLFNRVNGSYDHVGKTGLFDLAGDYCFASYLVRVVPDTAKILPLYLTYVMNADAFRDELRSKAVRSAGQYNINATKMRTMKIPIPPVNEQKRFVKTVEALEAEIAAAASIIAAAPAKKEAVLKKYL